MVVPHTLFSQLICEALVAFDSSPFITNIPVHDDSSDGFFIFRVYLPIPSSGKKTDRSNPALVFLVHVRFLQSELSGETELRFLQIQFLEKLKRFWRN